MHHVNVVAPPEAIVRFLTNGRKPLDLFHWERFAVNGTVLPVHGKITVRKQDDWTEKDPKVLAMYHVERDGSLTEVKFESIWGVSTENNPEQAHLLHDLLRDDIRIVTVDGKAGTGKNFVVLVACLYMSHKLNRSLVYMREDQKVGRDPGALPGDAAEKNSGTLHPFWDTLNKIPDLPFQDMGQIEEFVSFTPVWELRGRTFDDTFLIYDEAQNSDVDVLKTFGTRAGKRTKVILLGSHNQIDNAKARKSFSRLIDAFTASADAHGHYAHSHLVIRKRGLVARLFEDVLEFV